MSDDVAVLLSFGGDADPGRWAWRFSGFSGNGRSHAEVRNEMLDALRGPARRI